VAWLCVNAPSSRSLGPTGSESRSSVPLSGGPLILKPGRDIVLQAGQAPSLVGNFSLQFTLPGPGPDGCCPDGVPDLRHHHQLRFPRDDQGFQPYPQGCTHGAGHSVCPDGSWLGGCSHVSLCGCWCDPRCLAPLWIRKVVATESRESRHGHGKHSSKSKMSQSLEHPTGGLGSISITKIIKTKNIFGENPPQIYIFL
jgi:hypothetical protein